MSEKPIILIAAGGTGGHMFPAKAFAEAMYDKGYDCLLVTDPRGKKYTEGFGCLDDLVLPVTNAEENGLKGKINAGFTILKSMGLVKSFMNQYKPIAVIGFGGYPTFPALMSAKCPIIIHEQNAVLGRVNRFFQGKAKKICSGFEQLEGLEHPNKHIVVGNPVRKEIVAIGQEAYPEVSEDSGLRILITGGSQGARILGQAVPRAIAQLSEGLRARLFVSHQVREEQCDDARDTYTKAGVQSEVWPFFKDMAGRLAKSHFVIGRSGASTVSETAVAGRPAIFIPLPSAMNDHQTHNAMAVAVTGGAIIIKESELTIDNLSDTLEAFLSNSQKLVSSAQIIKTNAHPDAANRLAQIVIETIGENNA